MTKNPEIEPLSAKEQAAALEAAGALGEVMIYQHKVRPEQILLIFLDTGMHPAVMANREKHQLKVEDDEGALILKWKRPKKKGKDAHVQMAVSKRLEPFIKELLAAELPEYKKFYNSVLDAIRTKLSETYPGAQWVRNVCPLGLRHTFGVNRLDEGLPERRVQQLMNCSQKTLNTYARYSKRMLSEVRW